MDKSKSEVDIFVVLRQFEVFTYYYLVIVKLKGV